MKIKIKYIIFLLFIIFIFGCKSTPASESGIWVTSLPGPVTRYYIPVTKWQESKSRTVTCQPDITYLDEPGRSVICNISFFNRNVTLRNMDAVFFTADGMNYPLENVNIMFIRPEFNEIRITSSIEINELLKIFNAKNILIKAVIDSNEYTFEPDKEFLRYINQFSVQLTENRKNMSS